MRAEVSRRTGTTQVVAGAVLEEVVEFRENVVEIITRLERHPSLQPGFVDR